MSICLETSAQTDFANNSPRAMNHIISLPTQLRHTLYHQWHLRSVPLMQKLNTPSTYTFKVVTKQGKAVQEFNYSSAQLSIATSIGWLTRMEKGLVISSQQAEEEEEKNSTSLDQIWFQDTFVIWLEFFFGTSSAKPEWTCPSTPTTMLTRNFTKYISTDKELWPWQVAMANFNIFHKHLPFCKMGGSHSIVDEFFSLWGCCAKLTGK